MTSIAWFGLGNMGSRMSAHLVSAGHEVRGYDPVEALRQRDEVADGIDEHELGHPAVEAEPAADAAPDAAAEKTEG